MGMRWTFGIYSLGVHSLGIYYLEVHHPKPQISDFAGHALGAGSTQSGSLQSVSLQWEPSNSGYRLGTSQAIHLRVGVYSLRTRG